MNLRGRQRSLASFGPTLAALSLVLCVLAIGCAAPQPATESDATRSADPACWQSFASAGEVGYSRLATASYRSIVEELVKDNTTLTGIIRSIWKSNRRYSIDRLDEGVTFLLDDYPQLHELLEPWGGEHDLLKAFLLNTLATKGLERRDGRPYANHPARLLIFLRLLLPNSDAAEPGIDAERAKRTFILTMLHDVFEEILRIHKSGETTPWISNQVQEYEEGAHPGGRIRRLTSRELLYHLREKTNREFSFLGEGDEFQEGDFILVLMAPEFDLIEVAETIGLYDQESSSLTSFRRATFNSLEFVVKNAASAQMILRRRSLAVVLVKFADLIDYFLNLEYLVEQRLGADAHLRRDAVKKFAFRRERINWTLNHLEAHFPSVEPPVPNPEGMDEMNEESLTRAVGVLRELLLRLPLCDPHYQGFLDKESGCAAQFGRYTAKARAMFRIVDDAMPTIDAEIDHYLNEVYGATLAQQLFSTVPVPADN